jgi:hypothetical protein
VANRWVNQLISGRFASLSGTECGLFRHENGSNVPYSSYKKLGLLEEIAVLDVGLPDQGDIDRLLSCAFGGP